MLVSRTVSHRIGGGGIVAMLLPCMVLRRTLPRPEGRWNPTVGVWLGPYENPTVGVCLGPHGPRRKRFPVSEEIVPTRKTISCLVVLGGVAFSYGRGAPARKLLRPERRKLICRASVTSSSLVTSQGGRNVLPWYDVPPLVPDQVCRKDRTFGRARLWTLCTYSALVCLCVQHVLTVPCVPRRKASGEVLVFHGNELC